MTRPVDIAHSVGRNCLVIRWDDDAVSELPIPYLRGWCPCAMCQGHGDTIRYAEFPDTIRAAELHEMGAYALAIRFSDGHDAGIYAWPWLRRLAFDSGPVGWKRGVFRNGVFSAEPAAAPDPDEAPPDASK